ncbi:hypothetical protein LEP1GSC150_2342 [Leptospira interrogans serovar Copenhageni str. LT2050]|uniref:Uncharacterized protein n=1 Tax=Leptospira interrogans serovar Copenhageni str. LT2050 TaxID=1001598 RepID=M3HQV0_LEPIT|nr:hypothetical protein LEP1GSC150_2342 [Leptospira interrogans serovar Copenhageni str. LT2050]
MIFTENFNQKTRLFLRIGTKFGRGLKFPKKIPTKHFVFLENPKLF